MLRKDWSQGWVPDADSENGPPNALLRADNVVLDELGALAQRLGFSQLSGPFQDGSANTNILSLYTMVRDGTRHRYVQAGQKVFRNGTEIGTYPALGEAAWSSYMGQAFFAHGIGRNKDDGTTIRGWGIDMTGGKPTVTAEASDTKTFASFDSTESPAFVANEGTIAFAAGQAGAANGSLELTAPEATGRATATKLFAADVDFTEYDGLQLGTDDDLLDIYVHVSEPTLLESVTVLIDVNSTTADNAFKEDYYYYEFKAQETIEIRLENREFLADIYNVEGFHQRAEILQRIDVYQPSVTVFRQDKPTATSGWNRFSLPRGRMKRVGSTAGKNWSTVRAVRVTFQAKVGGSVSAVRFDDLKIVGGANRPMTGKYRYRYCYARDNQEYFVLSPPSVMSDEIEVKANSVKVTVPADAVRDTQVQEIHVYRMGGHLDRFYRVAVLDDIAGDDFFDAWEIEDTTSDRDALILNIPLETDNAIAPPGIIGISEPYFSRIFALTETELWPSKVRNPEHFSLGQVIRVADRAEKALWIRKAFGGLYVGTTKDIYRIDGDGAEYPDGTINLRVTPLNIGNPPIDRGIATEGENLVYMAADGWRRFDGRKSESLTQRLSLLFKGYTRHGISPQNIAGATRWRMAMSRDVLLVLAHEGSSTDKTGVLYKYHSAQDRWYRHLYPKNIMTLHREPDGTLLAGTADGFVLVLETGTLDAGANIPVAVWTVFDDDGKSNHRKDGFDFRARVDTGAANATFALHKDSSGSPGQSLTVNNNGMADHQEAATVFGIFKRMQLRISGTLPAFRLAEFELNHRLRPMLREYLENRPEKPSKNLKRFGGFSIIADTLGGNATVTPIMDGTPLSAVTLNTSDSVVRTFPFNAERIGYDLWVRIAKDTGFEFYQMDAIVNQELPDELEFFENRPLEPHCNRRRFSGLCLNIDTGGNNVTVTPILDGSAMTPATVSSSDPLTRLVLPASFVGRDLWARITGANTFQVYKIEPTVIEEFPQQFQGIFTPVKNEGHEGTKVINGLRMRLCTLNASRTVTLFTDHSAEVATFAVTSPLDEPKTVVMNFPDPVVATDFYFSVNGLIELYEWAPQVMYTMPTHRKVWDTGYIDLSNGHLTWIREVRIKVRTAANLIITPYFDDRAFSSVTKAIGDRAGEVTIFHIPVGREYKGRSPRLIVKAAGGAEFNPFWAEFHFRPSGNRKQKRMVKVEAQAQ